ncbi:MAG: hypothetical protein IT259_17640, partial [Saprospiraceae bacterium]|nr:hypothetical protein [Saprospiraceae bacterium]
MGSDNCGSSVPLNISWRVKFADFRLSPHHSTQFSFCYCSKTKNTVRKQTTRHILMVRPANFAFNEETAVNNAFQTRAQASQAAEIHKKALREFDAFVDLLRKSGVHVVVAR